MSVVLCKYLILGNGFYHLSNLLIEHFQKKIKCFVIIFKLFLIETLAQMRIKVPILQTWDMGHRRGCMERAVVVALEWPAFSDF